MQGSPATPFETVINHSKNNQPRIAAASVYFASFDKGFFPDELKYAEVVPVFERIKRIKITTDLSEFCLIYQNYMKGVCINKSMNIMNHFYQIFNAVLDKDSGHNTVF